jgi:hypothetical protein
VDFRSIPSMAGFGVMVATDGGGAPDVGEILIR